MACAGSHRAAGARLRGHRVELEESWDGGGGRMIASFGRVGKLDHEGIAGKLVLGRSSTAINGRISSLRLATAVLVEASDQRRLLAPPVQILPHPVLRVRPLERHGPDSAPH